MTKIQLRRDTATNWTSANPILASGEPAFETDTGKFKIGDGVTAYNSLPYKGEAGAYNLPQANATTLGGVKANSKTDEDTQEVKIDPATGILYTQAGSGTTDYTELTNKPQINSITLEGNKTATDLGLATTDDVNELETSKQNVFTVQKPIYLDKKQESDKVGWGYENPYLVPQNEINLTERVGPTYIQYNTDSTNKMPSNYMLFPLYEQDTDPASAIIKVPIAHSTNNYEKLFFGKYVDGYFVPLCYFTYQSFYGNSVNCKPYAIGGVNYTNPIVTSASTSGSVATINIEGNAVFQRSTRGLQVQGGWGQQLHSSITSQPLDNLFEYYWPYGGNMYGMAINLQRNPDTGAVNRIGCTYTNGRSTYMITSTDTDLCELLSEATFALYCFDVSTPTPNNNKDHRLFGYYKYSDTGATTMPWLLTGQSIDEFWTNVLQHNSFTTGAQILDNNQLRLGVDNNTIKVNSDGNLYANISVPANITTQGNTFNGASQLVQLDGSGKLPAIDGSQLTNLPAGSAPANMVTTDTNQTITGTKNFTNATPISFQAPGSGSTLFAIAGDNRSSLSIGDFGQIFYQLTLRAGSGGFNINTQAGAAVNNKAIVTTNNTTSLIIWRGTQSEYDGITSKDENTLYIITG